jgi:hypothetical protein
MKTRSTLFLLTLFLAFFVLPSCQKTLDNEHIEYIGTWSSDKHSIEIYKNGRGVYQRQNQEAFECDVKIEDQKIKFRNGIFRTFDITGEPQTNLSGQTTMLLDGNVFYKH